MATKGQLRDKDARNIYPVTKSDLVSRPGGGDVEAALKALEGGRGLRPLFEAAGAKYNESTGFYELNGLTDITEAEMAVIYNGTNLWWYGEGAICSGIGARTNIPPLSYANVYNKSFSLLYAFQNSSFEKLVFTIDTNTYISINKINNIFIGTRKLKVVSGAMSLYNMVNDGQSEHINSPSLEEIEIIRLNKDLRIGKCAKLSLNSFKCIVDKRFNDNNSITVTVHPDVMAKFEDAEGHPEWHALMQQAAEKQISFATE